MSDAPALRADGLTVTVVNACLREGGGGSPTAVLEDGDLSDEERRAVPAATGASHAVFVSAGHGRDGEAMSDGQAGGGAATAGPAVSLRFFTAAGELPGCGHGTVAALAFLAERAGQADYRAAVRTRSRVFAGHAVRANGRYEARFDPGSITVREPAATERGPVLDALNLAPGTLMPGACVASPGRPRLLVPVATRAALAALPPDLGRLREACDRLGLLGCYVYSEPTAEGRLAARMFAPSIGVPEDVANANSTACLAAHLARSGHRTLTVDMGDALGRPSAVTTTARLGEAGPLVLVGGDAAIDRVVRMRLDGRPLR